MTLKGCKLPQECNTTMKRHNISQKEAKQSQRDTRQQQRTVTTWPCHLSWFGVPLSVLLLCRWGGVDIVCPHTQQLTYIYCSGNTAGVLSTVRLRGYLWGTVSMCVQCTNLWWFVSSNHAPTHAPTHTNSHPANSQLSSLAVSTFLQGFTVGSSAADFLCTLAS